MYRPKELLFEVPKFNDGKNVTVRRGIKWSLLDKAYIKGLGVRDISSVVVRFRDIVDEDIEFEHDPACRTSRGLRSVMLGVYDDFDTKEIVTIVSFVK